MLFWNDPHHVCFSVIPEKHIWLGSFQKSIHDEGLSRKAYMMKVSPEKHT
jgi:hypothetical protein